MGLLVVAATARELECAGGARTLACGIGPVEAAIATGRELAGPAPRAVLLVGLAGGRGIEPGTLVLGSESLYCDLHADVHVPRRVLPDEGLLAAAREALPDARVEPIGTSADPPRAPRPRRARARRPGHRVGLVRGRAR